MTIIVYNPQYISQDEIARILREMYDRGIVATTVTHHNPVAPPFYIEQVTV